ncbi:hypothetical protein [Bradyrhizobium sp. STM 3557]|uniref:hypothetical protein n=1 Tax=Bradyrhizobium sp. STM 3557 TaxID=578920 RepID=UPI00388FEE2E
MPHAARRRSISYLLAIGAWLMASSSLPQESKDFDADLLRWQQGSTPMPAGRLTVSAGRARLDLSDLPDGYFIIDGAGPSATFVKPGSAIYMEARQSSRLTQWFVPVHPADPCPQWQAMARIAGEPDHGSWHCEQDGEAVIGGRHVIGYRAMTGTERQFLAWIDPTLSFPVRIELGDGAVFAIDAVKERPQPPELTQIPSGFRKFDPQALIERIKQSDVWVAH